ncbi:MAG: protoheme IX farnesyltransferase [Chloroflexi bacterium]|jgi:protoheme IX farnesyltransferase|nr:MAG: protoheme IX farnesyltransferase [Chloroflexota bacterium]RLT28213.1 MAG: protoheme IX farnesyltransferase [Chloroflexota bacterium]
MRASAYYCGMVTFRRLLRLLLGATVGLVVVGVIVRATESGMGCPDWPLCYGQIIPPLDDYKAWLEWIHRTIAAGIGLIVLGVVAASLRSLRGRRSLQGASLALLALVLFQAWLGRQTVLESNSGRSVTAHLATAMAFAGLQVWVYIRSGYPEKLPGITRAKGAVIAPLIAAGAVYALLLFGSNVTATDTGLIYPDWPLMGGTPVPPITELAAPQILHRYATGIVALVLIAATWIVRREAGSPRRVKRLLEASLGIFAVQCIIGALQIVTKLAPWTQTLHVALATTIWLLTSAAAVTALLEARVGSGRSNTSGGGSMRSSILAYVALTKPRIVELLLITTVPAMLLAARGMPSPLLIGAALIGGTLSAASANVFNCIVDADIDARMARTKSRPLVAGSISIGSALRFASLLGIASFLFLAATTTMMAAFLSLLALAFYVLIYTLILKRSTPQNIVIGGAAGALPPVIGWAAVTGDVTLVPILLFALVFYWTPPHFWALALRIGPDYAAAGVPMLPVLAGPAETARQIWLYTILLVAMSLILWAVAGMGLVYLAVASIGGAIFLLRAWRLRGDVLGDGALRGATRLYRFSITYLTVIFASIAIDALLPR